ncbi:AAA family ATPase [Cysteiniphilum litorale]|uniref:Ti-type conjugative transfer relaxase TraA n=3 Tax=Cysteiniphilum litorale TaxID=2056700 RepID=A0A8J3E9Y8_9GAMM|nr:AAA family ATPase [Cysteiniphilum litorale]GGG06987.1 hypothetical protein GCM10010995_25620 [Cysteiniphilum litorale]
MAIYHYSRNFGKRAEGFNAVFAAAYIRGESKKCIRLDKTIDFSDKNHVVFKKSYLPENAPEWVKKFDPSKELSDQIWNRIELIEKHPRAQLCFHDDVSIPLEFSFADAKELVDEFVKKYIAVDGMFADVAMHWEKNNPHFHILMPMRQLTEACFSNKMQLKMGELKEMYLKVRGEWSECVNEFAKRKGLDVQIDHRSYADRGLDLVPMKKVGKAKHIKDSEHQKYKLAQNQLIKAENLLKIQDNPEIIIKKLEQEHVCIDSAHVEEELSRFAVPNDVLSIVKNHQHENIEKEEEIKEKINENITEKTEESADEALGKGEQNEAVSPFSPLPLAAKTTNDTDTAPKNPVNDQLPSHDSVAKIAADSKNSTSSIAQNSVISSLSSDIKGDIDKYTVSAHQADLVNNQTNSPLSQSALTYQVIEKLEANHGIFSDKQIKESIFEHDEVGTQNFNAVYQKVIQDQKLVYLGVGIDGRDSYTTKLHFDKELDLRDMARTLNKRKGFHVYDTDIAKVLKSYDLRPTQEQSLRHLLQGKSIGVTVGFAGTGKSFMMKLANEIWQNAGFNVVGTALSGAAAAELQSSSDIKSHTAASLLYQLDKGHLCLSKRDIIVVDEFGMLALDDAHRLMKHVVQAEAKLVGIGDDEQTQPIGPGASMRSIIDEVGASKMTDIIRQKKDWQREATVHFETQETGKGFDLYQSHGHVHFYDQGKDKHTAMLERWQSHLDAGAPLSEVMMLAHKNDSIDALNKMARERLVGQGKLDGGVRFKNDNHKQLTIAVGERLLFTRNDKKLGVKNGFMGTVSAVDENHVTVTLKSGQSITFDPAAYNHFNYAYAATIHKLQGATFDHTLADVDSVGWDRHLFLVGGTRHRENFDLFVDGETFNDLDHVKEVVTRGGLKDHIYDYPVRFAINRGFDGEHIAEHAAGLVSRTADKLHDAWLYLSNYQAYVEKALARKEAAISDEQREMLRIREEARIVASFADKRIEIAKLSKAINEVLGERTLADAQNDPEVQGLWDDLYQAQVDHGVLAHRIKNNTIDLTESLHANRITSATLNKAYDFYEKHEQIHALAKAYTLKQLWQPEQAAKIIEDLGSYQRHIFKAFDAETQAFDFINELRNQAANVQYEKAFAHFGVEYRVFIKDARDYIQRNHALFESYAELRSLKSSSDDHLGNDENKNKHKEKIEAVSRRCALLRQSRNAVASTLASSDVAKEVGDFFRIDQTKLGLHAIEHKTANDLIDRFRSSDASFIGQMMAAHQIKSQFAMMSGYVEHAFSDGWKDINIANWHFDRCLQVLRASKAYRQSVNVINDYLTLAKHARSNWQAFYRVADQQKAYASSTSISSSFTSLNDKGKGADQHKHKQSNDRKDILRQMAQHYAYQRDALAYDIIQNLDQYSGAIDFAKIDLERLREAAGNYDRVRRYQLALQRVSRFEEAKALLEDGKRYGNHLQAAHVYKQAKADVRKLEKVTLLRGLSSATKHQDIHLVKNYIDASYQSYRYYKKTQHAFDGHVYVDSVFRPKHLQAYANTSVQFARQADRYAYALVEQGVDYQSILKHQIKDESRLKTTIERIEEAHTRETKRLEIEAYLNPKTPQAQLEKLAYQFTQDSKGYYGLAREAGLLWLPLYKMALPEKLRQVRATLNAADQATFDAITEHSDICRTVADKTKELKVLEAQLVELRKATNGGKENIEEASLKAEIASSKENYYYTIAVRNEMAYKLAQKNPELLATDAETQKQLRDKFPHFYSKRFIYHVGLHEARLAAKDRIDNYLQSGMKDKAIAYEIMQNLGKHMFYLKNHKDCDIKTISIQALEHQYAEGLKAINDPQKASVYQALADYDIAMEKTKQAWAQIRQARRLENPTINIAELEAKASRLTDIKNEKAHKAYVSSGQFKDELLKNTFKRIDVLKLNKAAHSHQLVIDVSEYRKVKDQDNQVLAQMLALDLSLDYGKGQVYKAFKAHAAAYQKGYYIDAIRAREIEFKQSLGADQRPLYDEVLRYVDADRRLRYVKHPGAYHDKLLQTRHSLAVQFSKWPSRYESMLQFEEVKWSQVQAYSERVPVLNHLKATHAVNEIAPANSASSNLSTAPMQPREVTRFDVKAINNAIYARLDVYDYAFGQPMKATQDYVLYEHDRMVMLSGEKKGQWYDPVKDKYRQPADAFRENFPQQKTGMSHFEMAAIFAGLKVESVKTTEIYDPQKVAEEREAEAARIRAAEIAKAQKLWSATVPLKDTLAERYLKEHRAIYPIHTMQMRFLPKGAWVYEQDGQTLTNKLPMLVVPVYGKEGLTGVQRIYLDPKTADKPSFMDTPKLTLGVIYGSAGFVNIAAENEKGRKGRLYIAEGPETAASIAMADPKATVLTACGSAANIGKMKDMIERFNPSEVIIAGDNDGVTSQSYALTYEAQAALKAQGIDARVILPQNIEGFKKTDWNDVLVHQHVDDISEQMGLDRLHNRVDRTQLQLSQSAPGISQETKEALSMYAKRYMANRGEFIDGDAYINDWLREYSDETLQAHKSDIQALVKYELDYPGERTDFNLTDDKIEAVIAKSGSPMALSSVATMIDIYARHHRDKVQQQLSKGKGQSHDEGYDIGE